jgi:hypothetical protein
MRGVQAALLVAIVLSATMMVGYSSALGRDSWFLPVLCALLWTTVLVDGANGGRAGALHRGGATVR